MPLRAHIIIWITTVLLLDHLRNVIMLGSVCVAAPCVNKILSQCHTVLCTIVDDVDRSNISTAGLVCWCARLFITQMFF